MGDYENSVAAPTNQTAPPFYLFQEDAPYMCVLYVAELSFILAFYLLLAICIIKTPKLHTSGYILLLSLVTAENVCASLWVFGGFIPMTLHYNGVITYTYEMGLAVGALCNVFYYAASQQLFYFTVQRYCAIAYFDKYQKWFSKKITYISIFFTYCTALAVASVCYFGSCKMFFSLVYFGLSFNFENSFTQIFLYLQNVGYNGFIVTSVLFICILFLYKLKKLRKSSSVNDASQKMAVTTTTRFKDEMRLSTQMLIIAGWWCFGITYWFIVYQVLGNIRLGPTAIKVMSVINNFIIMAMFGLDSFIVIMMNKRIKKMAVNIICSCRPTFNVADSVSIPT